MDASHFTWRRRPHRDEFLPGSKNVKAHPLVAPTKALVPHLHIKLECMKNFVKGMDKDGEEFKYLQGKFLVLSKAKLQADIINGFQIRKPLKDGDFERSFSVTELQVWKCLKVVKDGDFERSFSVTELQVWKGLKAVI